MPKHRIDAEEFEEIFIDIDRQLSTLPPPSPIKHYSTNSFLIEKDLSTITMGTKTFLVDNLIAEQIACNLILDSIESDSYLYFKQFTNIILDLISNKEYTKAISIFNNGAEHSQIINIKNAELITMCSDSSERSKQMLKDQLK